MESSVGMELVESEYLVGILGSRVAGHTGRQALPQL